MSERGKIRNPEAQRVIRDYSGLRFYETITPSDIDGYVVLLDHLFFFLELKFDNAAMKPGQQRAVTRLVDAVTHDGDEGIYIIADHWVSAGSEVEIDAAICPVRRWYKNGRWNVTEPGKEPTVRQLMDSIIADYSRRQP